MTVCLVGGCSPFSKCPLCLVQYEKKMISNFNIKPQPESNSTDLTVFIRRKHEYKTGRCRFRPFDIEYSGAPLLSGTETGFCVRGRDSANLHESKLIDTDAGIGAVVFVFVTGDHCLR